MSKSISFGSSNGWNITSNDIKHKIIDYLYSRLDLSKYRYVILSNIQKLKFLQENEHYVSPSFKGYNYLLIMLTIDNKHYSVAIDRRKLSYHKSHVDIRSLQIIQFNITAPTSIYSGTILDGKLIQSNNKYIFLIQDCFYSMGNNITETEMIQKMNYLDSIFKTHFKNDKNSYCSNFEFKLNKLHTYDELEDLIQNLPKLSISTNGITFYPKISGINVLYIDKKPNKVDIKSNNNEVIEQKTYHIIHDFVSFLKSRTYSYEENGKYKTFWLSKTSIPDVYDLTEKENGDKLGIALIPCLKISQMCDNMINDKPVKFNCVFSNKFKKWIPLNPL